VDDLSLDMTDGEFMVLVGPSGCGKSTALRSIAGLEEITAGTISIGGRVVNDVPPKDRDIAMVFQNHALYPHMNVEQNLEFGLRQRKTPRQEVRRRVSEVAQMLGIEQYLGRRRRCRRGRRCPGRRQVAVDRPGRRPQQGPLGPARPARRRHHEPAVLRPRKRPGGHVRLEAGLLVR
jgi:multiple sugar transport system ATP-binding protein